MPVPGLFEKIDIGNVIGRIILKENIWYSGFAYPDSSIWEFKEDCTVSSAGFHGICEHNSAQKRGKYIKREGQEAL